MTTSRFLKTTPPLAAGLALSASLAFAAPIFNTDQQTFGDVPPLALTGFNLSSNNQKAFQVWFDPNSWSGNVVAYPVGTDGKTDVTNRLWDAAKIFAAKQACFASDPVGDANYWDTGRRIVTRGGDPVANIAFRWGSLSAAQKALLDTDATKGQKVLNFLRGDRANEKYQEVLAGDGTPQFTCGSATGSFRARGGILGDIVHGRPVFVGAPPADYIFDSYLTFKDANKNRAPRVYVGANDGMVHAFNAENGEEVWAYIPSMLMGKLSTLTSVADPYPHTYFVDGGITAGDVNFGNTASPSWRTVIVGGLGAGGKGLYALDVTDPAAASEDAAKAKILWEITPSSAGFASLGDTYGTPVIARLNTGEWAAIVGNGYNQDKTKVAGATETAVLYIINIQTGALIKALDTGSGSAGSPNGLSSPTAVDLNFDGKVDRVYAGDIDGNLWKFDISASSAASWSAPASPLYATGKAIVGAPDVAAHPLSGYLVYFATGRLFTPADGTDATVQNYAYGIWDGAPAANNKLLEQKLVEKSYQATATSPAVRVRTALAVAPVNWNDASDTSAKPLHFGWRTELPAGERVIGTGFVRDGRYHFASVNPAITNTQPPNGENWLHELDFENGAAARNKPIFDLDGTAVLDDNDRTKNASNAADTNATGIPIAVFMGKGMLSQPVLAILSAQLSTTLFNDNPFLAPGDSAKTECTSGCLERGVAGGHFDVDIYYNDPSNKFVNKHTHEYDDIYDVTGVNMLNASDPGFNLSNAITSTTTPFKLLVANQRLSPAVEFSYGNQPYVNVTMIQTTTGLTMAGRPTYTRGTIGTLKFKMPKDAFAAKDWTGTGDTRVGLHPTQTGCVKGVAPGTLGPAGEYRNGALTFQLVKDTTPDSAVELAGSTAKYGYRLKLDATSQSYKLAEYTVFWHHPNGKCIGDIGWTATPPLDTSPSDPKKNKVPAAGSEDPPIDSFGAPVDTQTTSTGTTVCSGCTVQTTTITYSNGGQMIITKILKSDGKQVSAEWKYIPPPAGPGSGDGGIGQSMSTPNTVTGYQQTRNTGKLGRVTWHELFRQ